MNTFWVYIMTNKPNGTLYVGVTNNLKRRVWEHKNKVIEGFTSKYSTDKLAFFEQCTDINVAIAYEKKLKSGSRQRKIDLINLQNPYWEDLSEQI